MGSPFKRLAHPLHLNSHLKLLQWNCGGLRTSWGELRALLSAFSPACVALQETMLGDSTYSSPPGYLMI
ncbi:hypothetical protein E2C01_067847 [Portunus trituberculatus]|uniref:Endonuclease/exonuclease/phosphatase domain-containing protein n=1 Tax=Portunus trituberculatus TaxID=210409 RepID=A0A5B7HUQ9_PORTR|nr:hypothetical protein [Portunus trituberculatus]